ESLENDPGATWLGGTDVELVDQALGAEYAQSHAGRRAVAAGQDEIEVIESRPFLLDARHQQLQQGPAFHGKLDASARGVVIEVASQFRHRGRQAHLVPAWQAT